MAVKIRCSECHKKISVDEAFAGSMCRCPYCKNIVLVPEFVGAEVGAAAGARPSAPGRSERPSMPSSSGAPARGTGLSDIAGSRPIIHGKAPAPRRSTGPAQIKTPGVPQVPGEHSNIKSVDDMRDVISSAALGKASPSKGKRPRPAGKKPSSASSPNRARKTSRTAGASKAPKAAHSKASKRTRNLAEETEKILEAIHVDQSTLTEEQIASVPTANRVRIQGMISLVLMLLCLVGLVAIVFAIVKLSGPSQAEIDKIKQQEIDARNAKALQNEDDDPGKTKKQITKDSTPGGRYSIKGPALFALDTSGSTGECLADLKKIAQKAMKSVDGKISLAVIKSDDEASTLNGSKKIGGNYIKASSSSAKKLLKKFNKIYPEEEGESSTDLLEAIKFCLKSNPKTIVYLVGPKYLGDDDADEIAKLAKKKNVRLIFISLDQDDADNYKKCVKKAGNNSLYLNDY